MKQKKGTIKRVGNVSIEYFCGHIRLRWTFEDKRKSLQVCPKDTVDGLQLATAKAKEIDSDLTRYKLGFGGYDESLAKYSKVSQKVVEQDDETVWDLKQIWERNKELKKGSISLSTQANSWKSVDKMLQMVDCSQSEASGFVDSLLKSYSPGGLKRPFDDIVAATNAWARRNDIRNPWRDIKSLLPKSKKSSNRSKEAWSRDEINEILQAFHQGKHKHYYPYVAFLAYTGCRPEEAIALTWDDVDLAKGIISINKRFTHGNLAKGTKTNDGREIRINNKLKELLIGQKNHGDNFNLVFPSVKGTYIGQSNFNKRVFKPVIKQLKEVGKISKDLPTYNLRNSFISLVLRETEIDIATTAKMTGTSEKMILQHYWGADDSVVIPEI
ncbi:site-specific integrase [Dapis sp. BLCC M126]|uniref:site-specific integrase n=1 Tax=Dapis sp. BLCC M126 TaxID=3400189 RepID=UPI003CE9280F